MKLKYLATAAAAMIAASPAFAFLSGPDDGNAEVFLTVWSATAASGGTGNINSSYTLDLGVSLLDMIANKNVNNYINVLLGSDSLFNTFISTVNTTTPGALQFNVTAATRAGLDTPTNVFLSTVAGPTLGNINNLALESALDQVALFVDGVNGVGTHGTQTNGSSVATSGNAYFMTNNSNIWVNTTPLNSKAAGTNAVFGSYTQNGFGQSLTTTSQFAGTFFFGQSTPNVYSLQYQVAAVPEPTGYALALAGLGLIGFVGARRKS